jgi:hypothetical protein
MALRYVGSLTLGGIFPTVLDAVARLDATCAISLPNLQAKVDGLVNLVAALTITPPSLAANVVACAAVLASLQAKLSLGLPGIALDVSALATLLASIEGDLGSIQGAASFSAELAALLGTAGVHLWTYTGRADSLGGPLTAALAGGPPGGGSPSDAMAAIVCAATAPVPKAALNTFVGARLSVV